MPGCPTCEGKQKVFDPEFKAMVNCPDCNGKGIVTDKMLKFIEYYSHKEQVRKEINTLENDEQFTEQYHKALDD